MATPLINTSQYDTGCADGGDIATITATDAAGDDFLITTANNSAGAIGCFSGTSSISYIETSSTSTLTFNTDKRIIYGKEGDVMMDIQNMKFKVYCEEKGWVEYDLEDFSTESVGGKKKIALEGSRNTSVSEMMAERSKRKVLVEKMPKPKETVIITGGITIQGGFWGTDTITINPYNGYYAYTTPAVYYGSTRGTHTITTGTNNIALGTSALNGDATQITANGNTHVAGNMTVNGNMKVDGDLTVSGFVTCSNINTA